MVKYSCTQKIQRMPRVVWFAKSRKMAVTSPAINNLKENELTISFRCTKQYADVLISAKADRTARMIPKTENIVICPPILCIICALKRNLWQEEDFVHPIKNVLFRAFSGGCKRLLQCVGNHLSFRLIHQHWQINMLD